MLVAGKTSEVTWGNGNWVFLDIGFSGTQRSCALAFGSEDPICLTFADARCQLLERIRKSPSDTNLVIEAPLSVCFSSVGNPKGRAIERNGHQTRYWFVGPGCVVMVAATYVVKAIHDLNLDTTVRLFEGFVSFGQPEDKSTHIGDIVILRNIVRAQSDQRSIHRAEDMKQAPDDLLQSAFLVSGIDCGLPAIIFARKSGSRK